MKRHADDGMNAMEADAVDAADGTRSAGILNGRP
jgi:hypothetical protein